VTNGSLSYSTYGISTSDWGYIAHINLIFPFINDFGLELNCTYMKGLDNVSSSGGNFYNSDLMLMLGLNFALGKDASANADKVSRQHH